MSGKVAFISGPIQGMETRQGYRKKLAGILTAHGYRVLDPWKRERVLYRHVETKEWWRKVPPEGFIKRDLEDVRRCDLFIAYLPKLSAGTLMELFYAKQQGKKTIVICPLKNPSPWIIAHTSHLFRTMKEFEKWLQQSAITPPQNSPLL